MNQKHTEEHDASPREISLYLIEVVKSPKPHYMNDEDWADTVSRYKRHLQIMLSRGVLTAADVVGVL